MNMCSIALALAAVFLMPAEAGANDLFNANSFSSLASDRNARRVGDIITVVIDENATATNTAVSNLSKNSNLNGQISGGPTFSEAGNLNLADTSNNSGTTRRSGTMLAEISATVDDVLPNGDLHVVGSQVLNINGERTNIRVKGRVRLADISGSNAVLSSDLADAAIDYDGSGFVSNSAQPGIITRVLNWLGLP